MDRTQFWKLLEPFHPVAEAFCRRLAGNRGDGDDLYQDTLLVALRRCDTLRDTSAFRPWLFRILINQFKNRYRKAWWRHRVVLTAKVPEQKFDPGNRYDSSRWLARALAVLSAEDRALVMLAEIEGWSIAELAAMSRKPEGTIKARLSRARRKMRAEIERYLPQPKTNLIAGAGKYALPRSEPADSPES